MATEPLVPLSEIEAQANWTVRADVDGAVVADWAGRPAVPVSVAAELFVRAVAERDQLALERRERHAAIAAKTSPAARPEQGGRLAGLADAAMRSGK